MPKAKRKTPSDEILKRLYIDEDYTQKEIADEYGISTKQVSKHIKRLDISVGMKAYKKMKGFRQITYETKRTISKVKVRYFVKRVKPKAKETVFCQLCKKEVEEFEEIRKQSGTVSFLIKICKECYEK